MAWKIALGLGISVTAFTNVESEKQPWLFEIMTLGVILPYEQGGIVKV